MGQPIDLSTQLSKLRLAGDTFNTKYFASESYSTAGLIAKTAEPVIANSDHLRPDDVDQLLQAFKK